jgi:cytochrome c oxidase subunit III
MARLERSDSSVAALPRGADSKSAPSSTKLEPSNYGRGPDVPESYGGGDFGGWNPMGWSSPPSAARAGIYVALASVAMLFASLTLTFVLRPSLTRNLAHIPLPHVLYLNTILLAFSSVTLELAHAGLASARRWAFQAWTMLTLGLGLAFVVGQLLAWRELAAAGVYIAGNPSSAFFYLITGAHGLHLIGGLLAVAYLVLKAREIHWGLRRRTVVDVTRIYWHFMDGLWLCLFAVLLALRHA